jgi:hypothetical protein
MGVVEHLHRKQEALSTNPTTAKKIIYIIYYLFISTNQISTTTTKPKTSMSTLYDVIKLELNALVFLAKLKILF